MEKLERQFEGYAAGALEELGFGRMTPFVKLGLDGVNGERESFDKEISAEIDNFRSNMLENASKLPPLGNFQTPAVGLSPLTPVRLSELLRGFNSIIGKAGGPNTLSGFDGLRKVFGAVNLLYSTFNDYKQYTKQAKSSVYSNLRM